MANTSSFSWTNTSDNENLTVKPTDMDMVTNYAKVADEPTYAVLSNKTSALDQAERVTYRCNDIKKVSSSLKNINPPKVAGGVQYSTKIETFLRTVDGDGNIIVDEPVNITLTLRHPKSAHFSNSIDATLVKRLLGTLVKSDGTYRFEDMMRSALVPSAD
jgi:hypothetical protein